MHAADDVIERYRNNSDPVIEDFDWQKAAVCLKHVLEMDPGDRGAQGKLALVEGYLSLVRASAVNPNSIWARWRIPELSSRNPFLLFRALPILIWGSREFMFIR